MTQPNLFAVTTITVSDTAKITITTGAVPSLPEGLVAVANGPGQSSSQNELMSSLIATSLMNVAWLCFADKKIACLATTGDVSDPAKIKALFAGYVGAVKDLFTVAFAAAGDAATEGKTTTHQITNPKLLNIAAGTYRNVCVQQKVTGADWADTNLNAIVKSTQYTIKTCQSGVVLSIPFSSCRLIGVILNRHQGRCNDERRQDWRQGDHHHHRN